MSTPGSVTLAPATISEADDAYASLAVDGYAILENVLTPEEVAGVRGELAPHLDTTDTGRDEFEGLSTQRVCALLAKSRVFDDIVSHSRVLPILERILGEGCLLSAATAINIGPGETAQAMHYDESFYRMPKPRATFGVATMWAISDFTADNGATRLIPGSHRWPDDRPTADEPWIAADMRAGSVLLYTGTFVHSGGANITDRARLGLSIIYCKPWVRPQETMTLCVTPEMVAQTPERVRRLLGYDIVEKCLGHVNGMHPDHLLNGL
jgi:ectoine hydroxylase-related dioxygenase (phytanoyl-CoA dioxygenase family)